MLPHAVTSAGRLVSAVLGGVHTHALGFPGSQFLRQVCLGSQLQPVTYAFLSYSHWRPWNTHTHIHTHAHTFLSYGFILKLSTILPSKNLIPYVKKFFFIHLFYFKFDWFSPRINSLYELGGYCANQKSYISAPWTSYIPQMGFIYTEQHY